MNLIDWLRTTIIQPETSKPRSPLPFDDMPDIERIIREDFDHFDDVYLRGEANMLMRQRTCRLCEDIVRHVLRETQTQ